MTDCPNAEMRDRLPDLLHDQLDATTRALVASHVAECEDCRAELALLREAYAVLTSGMASVDVAPIVRVVIDRTIVPLPVPSTARRTSRQAKWFDWRVAASVALLLVGAGFYRLLAPTRPERQTSSVVVARDLPTPVPNGGASVATPAPAKPSATRPTAVTSAAELSAAGGVSDLSESELRTLLKELDQIDAVPSTEPEPVGVRVAPTGAGSSE